MQDMQAIRVKLYPTTGQQDLLARIAGCCRALANAAIDQRRWARHERQRVNYQTQSGELGAIKEAMPWLAEAPHHCLQQTLLDVERAYANFWSGRAAAPKRKKRSDGDSFRFPDPLQIALEGDLRSEGRRSRAIKAAWLKLPKLGRMRCVLHRSVPVGARLRSATLVREGSVWCASILFAREVEAPVSREAEPIVGLDLGVAQPVVLATGQKYALPKATALDRAHEARLQQRISRKKKGSANRRKAVARLAAFKAHQARRRRDAMEKVTTLIAKNHGVIAMEALQVRVMTASAAGTAQEPGKNVAAKSGLNRSLLDVSPGAFRLRLGQKLARSGGALLLVPAAHTSQRCSRCGHIEAGNRASRDGFACLKCGHCEDADINAARNIGERARGVWGDASKVEVAASLGLLLAQQAKPKRGFKRKASMAGGLPASACQSLVHVRGGALPRTHQAKAGSGARRRVQGVRNTHTGSPALQGRE